MNFLLDLEFDGSGFFGWQIQPGRRTVQGEITRVLERLLGEPVKLNGAGRTDRGVHAHHMIASFHCKPRIPLNRLLTVIQDALPADIRLLKLQLVPDEFHARFSARSRTYRYVLSRRQSVFQRSCEWQRDSLPEVNDLNRYSGILKGEHDFRAFCKTASVPDNSTCHVHEADWHLEDERLVFTIRANRFLHQMVRSIVGTLIAVAEGSLTQDTLTDALMKGVRVTQIAPPNGLYLERVEYELFE